MSTAKECDTIFEIAASSLRFGPHATREVGMDLADMGARRVLVVTDRQLIDLPPVAAVRESLEREKLSYRVFDRVRVEPTDESFQEAIRFAGDGDFDAFVAVGGGSTIDTAKAANLYATYPADFLTYVNAPQGEARPVPGPLKPLIAIPTTAGTGSETTGVAIFDLISSHAKTGIAHRRLQPTLGIIDPENTRTQPPLVAASAGLDVLCHALESYTAIPYDSRPRPARPLLRPAYQGANPISDVWSRRALELAAAYLLRAWRDPADDEARAQMLLASSYAGIGFGNAGVHLCHGMSYPVSSMVRGYHPPGYPLDHALVPHGVSVVLTAPAVFRFTAAACPERHLEAARILGAASDGSRTEDAGEAALRAAGGADARAGLAQRPVGDRIYRGRCAGAGPRGGDAASRHEALATAGKRRGPRAIVRAIDDAVVVGFRSLGGTPCGTKGEASQGGRESFSPFVRFIAHAAAGEKDSRPLPPPRETTPFVPQGVPPLAWSRFHSAYSRNVASSKNTASRTNWKTSGVSGHENAESSSSNRSAGQVPFRSTNKSRPSRS